MGKKKKSTKIKDRLTDLHRIYANLPENEKILLEPTIQNVAYMETQLEELSGKLNEHGTIDTYKNGENQYGQKPSADLQSYNQLMKTYLTAVKQLQSALPKENKASALQTFVDSFDE